MNIIILKLLIILSIININQLVAKKPNLLLLKVYKNQNIENWVMSEKFDGVRAYWNGKNLLTRNGNIINAPKWFIKDYPNFEIDGELWTKRGDFENIVSIVRKKYPSKKWKHIKHCIFEVPNAKGNLWERLKKVKKYENNHIKIIKQIKIKDKNDLKKFLEIIEKKGGEGVVVRDPNSLYINKRTNKALKVKNFKDDECEIISTTEGKGKFKGILGSITCQLKNNIIFKIGVGFSLKERINPPKIGEVITFKYQNLTKYKKPRFPVFLRVKKK